MNLQIDFRSGEPIYLQIVDQIRRLVASGELKPGDQLPTVRQMAADLRVNFNTIARAYRLLDEAGLISTQHGRGTYVWEAPSDETMDRLRSQSLHEQVEQFLAQLIRLGFTPAEIEEELESVLATQKERQA
jgi:GntR family transcriptional regulator